ncbi:uncharacterized oxidoreductase YjmC isoform X1 [Drosophila albomicans]|uniref:Uncharacterized oxidoreductase YjmC isoform X1 n=1 Tax=Drosophila albomicans TaxID=7291 RepID=A0A6P8WF74_DROAB|nr:uncharacterized oxidoreductase YjmC isoform X1 [Drosophila albomicans]
MASLTLCCSRRALFANTHHTKANGSSTWRLMHTLQRRQQQLQQSCGRLRAAAAATTTIRTAFAIEPKVNANCSAFQQRCNTTDAKKKPKLVSIKESRRFMIDCFKAVCVPEDHAVAQAELLVGADIRGHFSHGMNRLEMYVNDLATNATDGKAEPEILSETKATAWVEGHNGLGAVVGNFCMDLAIDKAFDVGVGWVCAKGSNHYGMAGWYVLRAMEMGLVGMSMTNTSPLMAPTGAKKAALGTNPLSMGASADNCDGFLLDMATTAVAVGKIEMQRRKAAPIPAGWALDPNGKVTTDAELAFKTGCLMPLGGAEDTSGYKGFGLGAMVDILSGVMAGAKYSTQVRSWTHHGADIEADLGHVFIAVDPSCFAPDFGKRLSDFNSRLRGIEKADPCKPVLIAGDKEKKNLETIEEAGGIEYLENQLKTCEALAKKLKIKPLKFL